jgi:hypothetical protein
VSRIFLVALLVCSGCVHRPGNWRLEKFDAGHVLIPPDLKRPDVARRAFAPPIALAQCPAAGLPAIEQHRGRARVIVTRELANQPAGSLAAWASRLENSGCVAPGDGMKVAFAVTESLPLDPLAAYRLLYPDERRSSGIELAPGARLRVLSPILRDPEKGILEGPSTVTGNDSQSTLTARSTDNLLGYETSLYIVQPRTDQPGAFIAPVNAERHIASTGATERSASPSTNYFQFPPGAGFYRLFYESWKNDFSALVIAAPTPAELDRLTAKFEAGGDAASCQNLAGAMCVQIPQDVAVNSFIAVTVNGAEMLVTRGTTPRQLILAAKEPKPETVLARLTVSKSWKGQLVRLDFDRADPAILNLPLEGGEIIAWR